MPINFFAVGKAAAIMAEFFHLGTGLFGKLWLTPYLVLASLLLEVVYLPFVISLTFGEFEKVGCFLIGMSMIRFLTVDVFPFWRVVDPIICIAVLVIFTRQ